MCVRPAPGSTDTELVVLIEAEMDMERRKFTREFKVEAVRLIKDRGLAICRPRRTLVCTSLSFAFG